MFNEPSCNKRGHDSNKYFKTQIYVHTFDIITQQLNQRFVGMNYIFNIFNL